jgi:hypothetical protein
MAAIEDTVGRDNPCRYRLRVLGAAGAEHGDTLTR